MWSFTQLKDLQSAYGTLQYMVASATQRNCIITKTAEGKLFDSRLDVPIPSNGESSPKRCSENSRMFPCVYEYHDGIELHTCKSYLNDNMESQGTCRVTTSVPTKVVHMPVMKVLRWSFNDLIHACASMGNFVLAEQLMSQVSTAMSLVMLTFPRS